MAEEKLITEERARQGPKGRPVLMVLVGSLLLLGICLAIYMFVATRTPPDSARVNAPGATTSSGTTTPTGGGNPTDRTVPANPAYPAPTDATRGARPAGR